MLERSRYATDIGKEKVSKYLQNSVGQVYQTVRKGIEGSGLLLSWHGSWGAGGSYEE